MEPVEQHAHAVGNAGESPICVLHVVPSLAVRAGMLAVVENYHARLDPQDVQFDYLYFFDLPDNRKEEIESYGSRTFYLPFQDSRRPFKTIEGFFAEHDGEFDIVHCHPPFAPQVFARAAKRHGVKRVIAHSHSTKFSDKKASAARNWMLARFLGLFATDYVACSEGARVLLGRHGKDAFVLHNAIDCGKYAFNAGWRREVREELGIGEGTLLLGSVGRLAPEKNQVFMVDVLAQLRSEGVDAKLAIAGSGNCEESLRAKSESLGVEPHLLLLGNRADAWKLYSAFDVFLLSSFFEGIPLSALEAQASGALCLLSDAVARETGVVGTEFVSIDAGPKPWVDAIMRQVGADHDRVAAGLCMRQSCYDIVHEAERLTFYYKTLMGRPTRYVPR